MKKKKFPPIVLATNNKHKVKEIKAILKKSGIKLRILTLSDFPKRRPVVENKNTLEGNALKKAREVAKRTNTVALADDTGLFVKALRGKPGVYSARFAGPGCNFQDNCRKVLRLLKGKPLSKRGALFRTVAALALPSGKAYLAKGQIVGKIAVDQDGTKGFGYDPIFYVPRFKKTFAEMPASLKNRISHRGKAFARVPALIRKVLR